MKEKLNRRNFLKASSLAGFACCNLFFAGQVKALAQMEKIFDEDELIDPVKLNYCGYTCPAECKFKVASVNNDSTLLREAYNIWDVKNRFNVDFNADNIFCFGCKNQEQPEGVILTNCTVRQCAIEKGYDCCIECNELAGCDKDLWSRFPKFHEQVIDIQKEYETQKG